VKSAAECELNSFEYVDSLLKPIEPLLKFCLTSKQIISLAKELTLADYFTKGKIAFF